jgi:2-polyprenyl-3-methyl-5-hydroxy-6-metoxy-1,4-benzoquinol methylase
MPTDETEQDRLDLHHELMRLVWDGNLHEAPLKEPLRILDIGTGTGIWAIDMADKFPNAEVIGTDITPDPTGLGTREPIFKLSMDTSHSELTSPEQSLRGGRCHVGVDFQRSE